MIGPAPIIKTVWMSVRLGMSFHPRHPAGAEQAHKKEAALAASKGRSAPSEDPGGVQTGEPIRKMSLSRPKAGGCEPPRRPSSEERRDMPAIFAQVSVRRERVTTLGRRYGRAGRKAVRGNRDGRRRRRRRQSSHGGQRDGIDEGSKPVGGSFGGERQPIMPNLGDLEIHGALWLQRRMYAGINSCFRQSRRARGWICSIPGFPYSLVVERRCGFGVAEADVRIDINTLSIGVCRFR